MGNHSDSMGTKEREQVILSFLNERQAMFKPKALFDNLDKYENITFGYKTVRRRLESLENRGLVERVGNKSYYRITEEGREALEGDVEGEDLEPDE